MYEWRALILRRENNSSCTERAARREQAVQAARAAMRAVMPHFPSVAKAYLFGSVTRPGAMRRDSDIDIAIEGHLTAEEYFALWRDLERAMPGWLIDVVELDQDLLFAGRVRESGELIYER